ncbi:MAG: peptidyl-tRNA hydrolase, PTH1 family [Parcubacteria group bacterium Gr01-1014_91]|nr:MAG: peptidyl-tRNA hydrolase, PTH1 family [Parcubacteria group bacterium Gr01-1014_91]
MAIVIVGLGNPGKEYEKTRHNAGRSAAELVAGDNEFDDFVFNKKANALVANGAIEKENATLVLPETMMNASGKAVSAFIKSPKAAKNLLVIHDDLDLPLGTIKMVFARGSGGHKGVESWKPSEEAIFKKVLKKVAETVRLYASEGIESATQFANTR